MVTCLTACLSYAALGTEECISLGHLYLSGVWLGVDLRHDTKEACV